MLADADDSAKAIFTLSLLGKLYDPGQMIANFGLATHFQTYYNERTASFSTNCNVLGALLHASEPSRYMDQISTTVHYLCDSWAAGKLDDKWVCALFIQVLSTYGSLTSYLESFCPLFNDAISTDVSEAANTLG
jgi:hypothetical protein